MESSQLLAVVAANAGLARLVLIVLAVVCEVLAAFQVQAPKNEPINWTSFGFAFLFASFAV